MNFGATRYLARTRRLGFRQEIVPDLEDLVKEMLVEFYRVRPLRRFS